ncbi:disease resistance-like protein DSC1 [Gastrolobium bilobum]|uniref:disease resistance-like protein DSC1 n=1 Tax=Gastrolobium bilobum TaxID=150636 RepID=UPI002AB05543|nr:disease resistance-like protein DSC1 [Gastrolobium bilobum]
MASSSSFGASQPKRDVFLSFRGEDTRCTFTCHLYTALCRRKIATFIDDEEIERGDELSPTLFSAIESSKISITIFSENYAYSTWCLDELERIIECKEKKGLVVIPVFYRIDPSDVRHQRGTYEVAFTKHEKDFSNNLIKVQKWRTALREAANSAGWDSSNIRLESELVEMVVGDVLQKLNRMSSHVPNGLVGVTAHVAHVELLLCKGSSGVRIIGIWGMGGIGKTTVAEALYAKLSSQYEGCYFVADVREEWKNHRENDLRSKLLRGVLGDPNLCITTPSMTSTFVIERLQRKKLLIILDDVSDSKQIKYLVGEKDWFGPGSRIIVTTRNKDVFNRGVDGVYHMMELNFHEALKLFSLNAFQQDHPTLEYTHLSERVVNYAKGIPLALKVLGSSLHSKQPREWENVLDKLKKIPLAEIYDVLRLSYEGLDPEEQNIFLDIACCFKGETRGHITSLLDGCGFSTDVGIRCLQDKSLINVSKDNKVLMHDLIQEMGWQIVREKFMNEPGKRSRLWDPKEIFDVLNYNMGTDSIESIVLDMSQIKDVTINPKTFLGMYKLRLLKFYMPPWDKRSKVYISRGLECMPDKITYLRWDYFPLKSLPPSFCAEKLVELDLRHSLIEKLWDGKQDLSNLKSLYLSDCKHLIELPDLSLSSKLEEVHLDGCSSLMKVPSSILSLDSLFQLNLRGCKQLRYIQSEKQSRSLQWLNLSGCSRLEKFSVSSEKLKYLILNATAIKNLPPTFDTSLSITKLFLDNCSKLSKLPGNLGLLSTLNKLSLRGSNIENLPDSIKNLSQLRALNVSNCRRLRSLPELPFFLQDLNASNCVSLETVSNLGITLVQDSFDRLKKRSLLRQIQEEEKMSIRHRKYLGRFEFYNCIKLDQIARKTVMEEALIRIKLAAYLSSKIEKICDPYFQTDDPEDFIYVSLPVYIILPGSEVPNWFIHKITDSSTVKLFARWYHCCSDMGFAFYLVLGPMHSNGEKNHHIRFEAGCRYYFDDKYVGTCMINSSCNNAESDQVWLWYDKLKVVEGTSDENPQQVSFEFFVLPQSSGLVVKQCGVRPLYAADVIMRSSNEQEGNREDKRPYIESETSGIESKYQFSRQYDLPLSGSERQRIPGYRSGQSGISFSSVYPANVSQLIMKHDRFRYGDVVCVGFNIYDDHHHRAALRCLAQMLLDDYCYLGKLTDNINILSSIVCLSIYRCNVESLPASIEHLSWLKHISLRECKRLRSLPKLPLSLQFLVADNCPSLETVEFAQAKKLTFFGNSYEVKKISGNLIYEKVSKIELIDPETRVTNWTLLTSSYDSIFVGFNVASHIELWNVNWLSCEQFRLQDWETENATLLHAGRLLHQFSADGYTLIESPTFAMYGVQADAVLLALQARLKSVITLKGKVDEKEEEAKAKSMWDCGSPLYDSYELVSLDHLIDRHLMTLPSLHGSYALCDSTESCVDKLKSCGAEVLTFAAMF